MSHIDLEQGTYQNHRRSFAGSDASICFSDGEDVGSCYSYFYSTTGGSYDENSFVDGETDGYDSRRVSSVAPSEVEEIAAVAAAVGKAERECRICQLGLESNTHESGVAVELGCSCKDDLAVAHRQCAETWFKIKGNKVCEICHSIARNVAGANEIVESTEEPNEGANGGATAAISAAGAGPQSESRSVWRGQRLLNFILACMVFAFVISWLFHFNVSSS